MAFYLDTSAVGPFFIPDVHSTAVEAWLRTVRPRLVVGSFTAAEFSSVVSRALRMKMRNAAEAAAILIEFDQWRAQSTAGRPLADADVNRATLLIRDFRLKLRAPDALHLAMVVADGSTLVTFDDRLAEAARAVSCPVVIPGE